jgi:hypothetical protein
MINSIAYFDVRLREKELEGVHLGLEQKHWNALERCQATTKRQFDAKLWKEVVDSL